ncbi:hypothetical protein E2C01_041184 [Portunus trituberculatus]|uniref:Uncharacterized protein n=1 Tax=Portunus trituberculatus TaxID=210409 RepID=A0A5B7FR84_PORTR|nr:hypothetical protein [Portunus trituberculatus]
MLLAAHLPVRTVLRASISWCIYKYTAVRTLVTNPFDVAHAAPPSAGKTGLDLMSESTAVSSPTRARIVLPLSAMPAACGATCSHTPTNRHIPAASAAPPSPTSLPLLPTGAYTNKNQRMTCL